MMNTALSGAEICAIIETCAKAQVYSFTLSELCIHFSPPAAKEIVDYWKTPSTALSTDDNEISQPQSNFGKQITAEALNELILTDPVQYEKYISGEEQLDD